MSSLILKNTPWRPVISFVPDSSAIFTSHFLPIGGSFMNAILSASEKPMPTPHSFPSASTQTNDPSRSGRGTPFAAPWHAGQSGSGLMSSALKIASPGRPRLKLEYGERGVLAPILRHALAAEFPPGRDGLDRDGYITEGLDLHPRPRPLRRISSVEGLDHDALIAGGEGSIELDG